MTKPRDHIPGDWLGGDVGGGINGQVEELGGLREGARRHECAQDEIMRLGSCGRWLYNPACGPSRAPSDSASSSSPENSRVEECGCCGDVDIMFLSGVVLRDDYRVVLFASCFLVVTEQLCLRLGLCETLYPTRKHHDPHGWRGQPCKTCSLADGAVGLLLSPLIITRGPHLIYSSCSPLCSLPGWVGRSPLHSPSISRAGSSRPGICLTQ